MRENELPKNMREYILAHAVHGYAFFDKKRCFCSRCGASQKYNENFTHNGETVLCRNCNSRLRPKNLKYGRKCLTEYGRIVWFKGEGKMTYGELDEYIIDYAGYRPEVLLWPSTRFELSKESQRYYKHIPEWYYEHERWEERKNVKCPRVYSYLGYSKYEQDLIYFNPACALDVGTDLKYADFTNKKTVEQLVNYMSMFLKWQGVELLEKAGFENLVLERASGKTCRWINWRGNTLQKILKMNKGELKEFRKNPSMYRLAHYKEYKDLGLNLYFDDLNFLPSYDAERNFKIMSKYANTNITLKYLRTQNGLLESHDGRHRALTPGDYEDYLLMCKKMKYNIKDRRILRPKNLKEAHDKLAEECETVKYEKQEAGFVQSELEITNMKEPFISNGYLIRPAMSPKELIEESSALHHCVKTYIDRVAEGRCAILFIRKEEEPNTSLYTLELSPKHEVVQCRGKYNCAYEKEVEEFIKTWLSWLKKNNKAKAA